MGKEEIEIHFKQSLCILARFDELTGEVAEIAENSLPQVLERLNNSWESRNKTLFFQKAGRLVDHYTKLYTGMQKTSEDMNNSIKKIYEAELRSLQCIRARARW